MLDRRMLFTAVVPGYSYTRLTRDIVRSTCSSADVLLHGAPAPRFHSVGLVILRLQEHTSLHIPTCGLSVRSRSDSHHMTMMCLFCFRTKVHRRACILPSRHKIARQSFLKALWKRGAVQATFSLCREPWVPTGHYAVAF